jgi:CBS domain-containing protein
MTTDVVTVGPETEFREIVRRLQKARVSAAPVVDAKGRVLGVVSEADLLPKEAHAGGEDGSPEVSRRLISGRRRPAKERASCLRRHAHPPQPSTAGRYHRRMDRASVTRLGR